MPQVKPFKAWRYDLSKLQKKKSVFAPPYDVISPKQQDKLYKQSPYNVVRLILGKQQASDNASRNKYTRAGQDLNAWKKLGVLRQDSKPCYYVYEQDYKEEDQLKTRIGFFAVMKIDERAVLKHENTLAAPKQDRLNLFLQVRSNLSPIFGLIEDTSGRLNQLLKNRKEKKPIIDTNIDGVAHRVFRMEDPTAINAISKLMISKDMFIADGHHRFEVACQYKKIAKAKGSSAYVMTYFADCVNNPFQIYPTHRLVSIPAGTQLMQSLSRLGKIKKVASLSALLGTLEQNRLETKSKSYDFGVYEKKSGFYLLSLGGEAAKRIKKNPVDVLDVAVLHSQIISPVLGIHKIEKSESIDFTRDANDACQRVKKGTFDAAFFLRPTSLKEMLYVSKKKMKMPQKSTYFYPKLLSGLVIHGFFDNSLA